MRRIVSLLPSSTEMLYALGCGDRLVGVSHECNFPPAAQALPKVTRSNIDSRRSSADIDQQVKAALEQSAALYELDGPRIRDLAPDLVVTQSQCDVCAIKLDDVQELLQSAGELNATSLLTLAPSSLGEVFDDMRRLAEAAGLAQPAVEAAILPLLRRVEDVRQRVATRVATPRVAVLEWLEPMMIAGNWTPELLQIAGGEYGLAAPGQHSPYVDWDALESFAPEALLLAPCGFDLERSLRESHLLASHPAFQRLRCVEQQRVFVLDGDAYLNRSGPRLVDTVEIAGHLLHPGLIPNYHPHAWRRWELQ